ncbi:MAG: DUF5319 domain-containing protein [Frankiaceae bacterium]
MGVVTDEPLDPFAGDPDDPAAELARFDPGDTDSSAAALSADEREEVLSDLVELDVFRALLEPRGTRGLVVDCEDCAEPHYFGWDLLMANLRSILEVGRTRVHEPAYAPDPTRYVSWEYARGYADGVIEASENAET